MKTIEINLYKFSELSETAKQNAINWYRSGNKYDLQYIYDEAYETVKKFNFVFCINEGIRSWLDFSLPFEDSITELTGLRLRKYIINNFWDHIYTGKYFSLWSKKDKNPHYTKNGNAPWGELKARHSKVMFTRSCPLTGVYYDDCILQPIYDLIDYKPGYENMDIETLFSDCFHSLEKAIDNEIEYRNSDESIIENIEANDYDFTKEGEKY